MKKKTLEKIISSMQKYRFNFKRVLILFIAVLGFGQYAMAGGGGGTYYYAEVTAHVATTGAGTVYVNPDGCYSDNAAVYGATSTGGNATVNSGGTVDVYLFAKPNEGYECVGWSTSNSATSYESTSAQYTKSFAASTTGGDRNSKKYDMYAYFKELPVFYYSATASTTLAGETATVVYNASDYGEHWNSTSGTTLAKFEATTNTGYAFSGWSKTSNGPIVSTDNPYFIQLESSSSTQADATTVTYYARYSEQLVPPAIAFSETATGFSVTLSHPLSGATIYYTTDGSEPPAANGTSYGGSPFNVTSDLTTVKAVAVNNSVMSDVASALLIRQTGIIDGSSVVLNDYEDHTWTYYAGVDESVDGGNYNDSYAGKMYSPDPRNVKITYQANGGAVSISESETTFVYYKTIEKVNNAYKYQVISNPFSKRPNGKGFGGWKIIDGGEYIQGKDDNDVLALDEELTLTGLDDNYTTNCTSAEIVLQATWENANVYTTSDITRTGTGSWTNPYVYSFSATGGTYETNILYIEENYSNNLTVSSPVTITTVNPNTGVQGGATLTSSLTINTTGTVKIEHIKWDPSGNINGGGRNFTIGRGVTMGGTSRTLYGLNTSSTAMNQVLKVESGTFSGYRGCGSVTPSPYTRQIVVFGNDYDRAQNDNNKLSITGSLYGLTTSRNLGLTDITIELFHITTKSGKFFHNPSLTNADYSNSFYLFDYSRDNNGTRTLVIEGGEFGHIAGGANSTSGDNTVVNLKIRMKGGTVNGSIFGGAARNDCAGSKQFVFTGGTVKGWIAGGSNGYEYGDQGTVTGASYVYIGGNTQVNSDGDNTVINAGVGGTVYAAGCGQSPTSTSGQVSLGTNVVLADNAYVERGVYGGGSFGYCPTGKISNIYITGGEVGGNVGATSRSTRGVYTYSSYITGGVYGGACQNGGGAVNIYMTGGLVEGGLYGGSNVSGTISQNVNMVVTGGQVGTTTSRANIHGGGYGQNTAVSGNVDVTLGTKTGGNVTYTTSGNALVYGDVYGGSALGKVNGTTAVPGKHTNVTLNAGTIHGSLYGGGLGNSTTEADVYGAVNVKVYGGSVLKTDETGANGSGGVYGCNNINGAPQGDVSVDIYGTDPAPDDDEYAIYAVYGGGNQADYTYEDPLGQNPTVTIHNCGNSIEYVYGGGNAAAVPTTSVTIYGGNKIGNVFGGGNGESGTAADVEGGTYVMIYGGTIGNVYGGSNSKGEIAGDIEVNISPDAEEGTTYCPIDIDNVYGGGNKAPSRAGTLSIGCSYIPTYKFHIGSVYGGANQADIDDDIYLFIHGGSIDNVFGGNNSGNIRGSIIVNVDDDMGCGMEVGNVYGCGNLAVYSVYGYDVDDGTPKTSGEAKYDDPQVNIFGGTITGSVFGAGKGDGTTVSTGVYTGHLFGNTQVTMTGGSCGNIYGGGNAAPVSESTNVDVNVGTPAAGGYHIKECVFGGGLGSTAVINGSTKITISGSTAIGKNVYGGGNAGLVKGNTHIDIK